MAQTRDPMDVEIGPLPRGPAQVAGEVAKWLFWVQLRRALPAGDPALIRRAVRALERAFRLASPGFGRTFEEELRLIMPELDPRARGEVVRRAYRVHLQSQIEELTLGKLDLPTCLAHIRPDGRENIEAALAPGKGGIILFPHIGPFMLMIALTSLMGYRYTQYAARGFPPEEVLAQNPHLRPNRFSYAVRKAREDSEDRLPANFISLETNIRTLYRALEGNELVGIAFDGRVGNKFVPVPYLGRTALLNPGSFRLAASTGAAVIPTLCWTQEDGRNVATYAEPIFPRADLRGQAAVDDLIRRYVHGAVEPFVRRHPHCYAAWLVHGRTRAAVDDHPLFVDYAPDDRWKRYAA
ncbi:lysophospholipid acyltransferase family protein [Myxococcota bacterium]|nr:lysophospholipid acyltransferase family protein [Myxococcota bacterium]